MLAVAMATGGVLVARDADRSERRVVDDRLRRTAELSEATALAAVEQQLPDADPRLDQVLRATGSSLLVTVGSTTLLQAGVRVPAAPSAPIGFSTRTVEGARVRVFAKTLRNDTLGGLARLRATTSLRALQARQARLRERLLIGGLALLLAAGLGVWLAADLVLRPLRRLRLATAGIAGDDDLDREVPVDGPLELRSLAESFNAMLDRLARSARERNQALEATRRFAADAGHELRTPMTAIGATLSTIQRHPGMAPQQLSALAGDGVAEQRRLVDLLDGLQALARGDANPVGHEDVDLAEVVADSVQAALGRHRHAAVQCVIPEDSVVIGGWAPGLRMLVDNLVENALRHGRPDGTVRVTLTAAPGPVLTVEDDGPGVAPHERERIFEPFARISATDRPGSGLGLALVAQQAGHHGAQIAVDSAPAPLSGARFTVRFAAPSPQ